MDTWWGWGGAEGPVSDGVDCGRERDVEQTESGRDWKIFYNYKFLLINIHDWLLTASM